MIKQFVPKGLLMRALSRVLPLMILVMLAIGFATSSIVETTVTRQTHANMAEDARFGALAVGNSLSGILSSIRSLAGNDLIINALVDVEARDAYIPPFFNHLQVAGLGLGGRIAFTDYRGRVIASNWNASAMTDAPWLAQVIDEGREYLQFDSAAGLFVVPVRYQGAAEGAIVVSFPKAKFADVFGLSAGKKVVLVSTPQVDIYASDPEFARIFRSGEKLEPAWIEAHSTVPGFSGLQVTVAERSEVALAAIYSLRSALNGAIVFSILALGAGIAAAAFFTTRPISRFASELRNFGSSKDFDQRITASGSAEFNDLRAAFNAMLDRLQTVSQSHKTLEDAYQTRERTEQALQDRNAEFSQAIENMAQGLCVFDSGQRVIMSNDRFASMYGLSPEGVVPGTSLEDILRSRIAVGLYGGDDPDSYLRDRLEACQRLESQSIYYDELCDGRTIRISRVPMPDGSWVSTHEEVDAAASTEKAGDDTLIQVGGQLLEPLETLVESLRLASAGGVEAGAEMAGSLVGMAYRDAEAVRRYLDDVLTMSRARSDTLELARAQTDMVASLNETIERVQAFEDVSEVGLRLEETVGTAQSEVDDVALQRVMATLLSRAMRSSPPNTDVVLRFARKADRLRLAVIVEGSNVPPDLEMLLSGDARREDVPILDLPETDLAFLVARTIVEGHGGTLNVEAATDLGWTCFFELEEMERSILDEIEAERVDEVDYDSDSDVAYL